MREQYDGDLQEFENVESTKGVYARFYLHPKQDEKASAEAGRPIFVEREYVEIIAAGNSNNIIRRPVSDMDRRRFRGAYEKFRQGDTEQLVGTPLSEVTWIARGMIEELAYKKVRTVEQLAELNDAVCGSMPGVYDLKRKAQAWVEKADKAAPFTQMAKENEELKNRIAALEQMLAMPKAKGKEAA